MKPSAAMLKGWEAVGKQGYGVTHRLNLIIDNSLLRLALAVTDATGFYSMMVDERYFKEYGEFIYDAIGKLTIPQIAERLEAIGY